MIESIVAVLIVIVVLLAVFCCLDAAKIRRLEKRIRDFEDVHYGPASPLPKRSKTRTMWGDD